VPDDVHTRPTPEYGTEVPDEEPTSPDLLAVSCPNCKGEGGFLVTEWKEGRHHGVHTRCPFCRGHKTVSREQHAAWHAEHGKPHGEQSKP
jgi:hypothetical protein